MALLLFFDVTFENMVPLKPTFLASKVASLINMNPFERVFDAVYDSMAKHNIPLGTLAVEATGRYTNTGQTYLAEQRVLEKHLFDLVQPFISTTTTVAELQSVERNLTILGPLKERAANVARQLYGQLQEGKAIHVLKSQGRYGSSEQKRVEFNDFFIVGKTDGSYNGDIVEIKNRTRRFLGVTEYERPQLECYMRLFHKTQLYLCERLGEEERKVLVFTNETLWDTIVQRLTWVAQFMTEVQEQLYLQELTKEDLELQFHSFIAERVKME